MNGTVQASLIAVINNHVHDDVDGAYRVKVSRRKDHANLSDSSEA